MDIESLHKRREARRRAIHRRRMLAGVAVFAVGVAAATVALAGGFGGSPPGRTRQPSRARAGRGHPGAVTATGERTGRASRPAHPGSQPVPILMYHVIAAAPPGALFPGLYVSPGEFAEQMEALARAGWHAVTLDQVEAYWREGVPLPPGKPIVLSFDNGYHSQYSQALPVLRRLGWVGVENLQLTGLPPSQGGLSTREARSLVAAGWELDTQGFSHADLVTLDATALHYQVAVARRTVQERFGVAVNWFCYPSGHYNATVVAAVKAAGYEGSTTVIPGWAHRSEDPYRLHRLRVLGGTTPEALLLRIAGARDAPPAPLSFGA